MPATFSTSGNTGWANPSLVGRAEVQSIELFEEAV
jgi:hypothetical protein